MVQTGHPGCFLPKVEICYDRWIFFFGQPVKTAVWTYNDIRKVMTGKYEYTLGFVPDYLYSNVRLIG